MNKKIERWKKHLKEYTDNHPLGKLQNPALLVVDMQRYFINSDGDAYLPMAKDIVEPIMSLIDHFNRLKSPIMFTRHGHKRASQNKSMHRFWNGDLLYEDDPQAELIVGVDPYKRTHIIHKEHYSAFEETMLDNLLKQHGIADIVICGVMTHLCVETTARCGFMKGYRPIVIMDATATKDEGMHIASLRAMAHGFAHVVDTEEIISTMHEARSRKLCTIS